MNSTLGHCAMNRSLERSLSYGEFDSPDGRRTNDMERKTTLSDLAEARERLERTTASDPIAARAEAPDAAAVAPSGGGPRALAWVGALLYAFFGVVSAALFGSLWGPLGFACMCGAAFVGFSPLCVQHQRRVLAGTLLIAGGVLIGGVWGFGVSVFGAETYAQLAVATLIIGAFVGWPPILAGAVLVGRGIGHVEARTR